MSVRSDPRQPTAVLPEISAAAADGFGLSALVIAAAAVPLLPPLGWKVQLTLAAAALQVAALYMLARAGGLHRASLDLPALAYLAAATWSTALSADRLVSLFPSPLRGDGLLVQAAYVCFGLGAARLPARHRLIALWAMLAAGAVIGAVAVGQYYGADPLAWLGFRTVPSPVGLAHGTAGFVFAPDGPGGRGIGTLGQSMFLGGLAVLLLPLAVAYAVAGPRQAGRLMSAAAAVLLYGGLVASQSRTAWIAAVASGAALVGFLPKSRIVWTRLAALVALLAAITVVMTLTRPQAELRQRALSVVDEVRRTDRSWGQRIYIWEQTLQLIRQRPLAGWGFSALLGTFPGYGTAEYGRRFGEDAVHLVDNPHNELLSVALSTGVIGLGAYLGIWAAAISALVGQIRRVDRRALGGGLLASLLGYFIWMQTAWSPIGVGNLLWILLGLAAAPDGAGDSSRGNSHGAEGGI